MSIGRHTSTQRTATLLAVPPDPIPRVRNLHGDRPRRRHIPLIRVGVLIIVLVSVVAVAPSVVRSGWSGLSGLVSDSDDDDSQVEEPGSRTPEFDVSTFDFSGTWIRNDDTGYWKFELAGVGPEISGVMFSAQKGCRASVSFVRAAPARIFVRIKTIPAYDAGWCGWNDLVWFRPLSEQRLRYPTFYGDEVLQRVS